MSSCNQKYNFTGKVALVTGSSSGIGEAIATQFAQYGASVTITGRNVQALEKIASNIEQISGSNKPLIIVGDLITDDSLPKRLIEETVAHFGRLDFLVNNAGWSTKDGKLDSGDKMLIEFDRIFKLNVRCVVELIQLAMPHLEQTKGNIINISSIASIKPYVLVYSTSKAALDMVTKTTALELGPKGIRVNSINPGPVVSGFGRSMGMDTPSFEKAFKSLEEKSLLKYIGQTKDIANLASFLASDDAVNITGSILVSDSGFLIFNPN